jgi:hypothetical protein
MLDWLQRVAGSDESEDCVESAESDDETTAGSPATDATSAKRAGQEQQHMSDTEIELPLDQVFELLKNERRRETVRYLEQHDGSGMLSDVAEHIAALENDTTTNALTSSERKRVYVGLYQFHLPKMDEMGVIDFDKNRGTIQIRENVEQLNPYLDVSSDSEWYKLYLSVTILGIAVFGVLYLGASGDGVGPSVALFVFLLAILGIGILHARGCDHLLPDRWSG